MHSPCSDFAIFKTGEDKGEKLDSSSDKAKICSNSLPRNMLAPNYPMRRKRVAVTATGVKYPKRHPRELSLATVTTTTMTTTTTVTSTMSTEPLMLSMSLMPSSKVLRKIKVSGCYDQPQRQGGMPRVRGGGKGGKKIRGWRKTIRRNWRRRKYRQYQRYQRHRRQRLQQQLPLLLLLCHCLNNPKQRRGV